MGAVVSVSTKTADELVFCTGCELARELLARETRA